MEQIFVSRPWLGSGLADGDVLLGRVGDECLSSREPIVEL